MGRGSSSDLGGRRRLRSALHTTFAEFATSVIRKSQVTLPILLVALVYIERSRPHLFIELEQWACERIFLGALVVASKVSLDPTWELGFLFTDIQIDYSFSMSTTPHRRIPIGLHGPVCLENAMSAAWNGNSSTYSTGSFPCENPISSRSTNSCWPPLVPPNSTYTITIDISPVLETPRDDRPHSTLMTIQTGATVRMNLLPHRNPTSPLGRPFIISVRGFRSFLGDTGTFLQVS